MPTVKLTSKSGDAFELDVEIAKMSELLKGIIEMSPPEDIGKEPIPLENVDSDTLRKVIGYMEYHHREPNSFPTITKPLREPIEHLVGEFDRSFVDVPDQQLFSIILAANYLNIRPLLDLSCAKVASIMRGKTTEQLRQRFNIVNDFSEAEEARVREEMKWALRE